VTTRQRYETQHAVGSCGVCHTRMDEIGFGLENFDGVGVYRTKEAGMPVDASGYNRKPRPHDVLGAEDLARKLAAAPEVGQCLAAQMTAYVLGVNVTDGLCIAPAAAYAQGATPLALADVLHEDRRAVAPADARRAVGNGVGRSPSRARRWALE